MSNGRVLVVDSERLVTEMIVRRLQDAGFEALAMDGGETALEAAMKAEPSFDVMLVGTRMTDGSGLDFVRRVRTDPRTASVSIALLTVLRDPEETLRALEAGADDCLRKPIHRVELVARVQSLCRIKRQMDELRRSNAQLVRINQDLDHSATTDALTRLPNRRQLEARLAEEVARFQRYAHPLSLLVIDIDHFKPINDTYGHAVGDEALRLLGSLLRRSVREVDLAARFGGEEFVIVAPSTAAEGGKALGERLRAAVAGASLELPNLRKDLPQPLRFTVSVGVAEARDGCTAETLFREADGALYAAKRGGRDRVVVAGEEATGEGAEGVAGREGAQEVASQEGAQGVVAGREGAHGTSDQQAPRAHGPDPHPAP